MSILFLDTTIISDMMRDLQGAAATRAKLASIERGDDTLYTSTVVQCELEYGIARKSSPRLLAAYKAVMDTIEVLPLDLYIPIQRGAPKKLPAMLVLHETDPMGRKAVDGQGNKANRAHARELAQRGYIVIAPDFPSFGDTEDYDFETDRYKSGTMKI